MQEFINALSKRSSLSCITREQLGLVALEFVELWDAEAFVAHARRIETGLYMPISLLSHDDQAIRRQRRQYHNFMELIEIFKIGPLPSLTVERLLAVEREESQHIEYRYRVTWAFKSGPKAADLLLRLQWLLDSKGIKDVSITAE